MQSRLCRLRPAAYSRCSPIRYRKPPPLWCYTQWSSQQANFSIGSLLGVKCSRRLLRPSKALNRDGENNSSHVNSSDRSEAPPEGPNDFGSALETYSDYVYQSGLSDISDDRDRLVDNPIYQRDMNLWIQLLEFRLRLDGRAGVLKIWHAMRIRNVPLPVNGPLADQLWNAIIDAAAPDEGQLNQLHHEINKLLAQGLLWAPLYTTVIVSLLRTRPHYALKWHFRMVRANLCMVTDTKSLIETAMSSRQTLHTFKIISSMIQDLQLYSQVVPPLCTQGRLYEALEWHNDLIIRNDLPLDTRTTLLLRNHFNRTGHADVVVKLERDLDRLHNQIQGSEMTLRDKLSPLEESDFAPRVVREFPGFRNVFMTDSFAARIFATPAFSLDFCIFALTTLGLDRLESLALRELAVRCSTPEEIFSRLNQVQDSGIVLSEDVYCRLIRKLAVDNNETVLRAVLRSDQHPEVYSDEQLQHVLLEQFVYVKDWAQVHKTLLTLAMISKQNDGRSWNLLLSVCVRHSKWTAAMQVLNDMQAASINTSDRVAALLSERVSSLDLRTVDEQKIRESKVQVNMLTNLCRKITQCGGIVYDETWFRIFYLLGSRGRLPELRNLVLWLCDQLAQKDTYSSISPKRLNDLFPRELQASLLTWGFKSVDSSARTWKQTNPIKVFISKGLRSSLGQWAHWQRGLLLLRAMKGYGVDVKDDLVRDVCSSWLTTLFDPNQSEDSSRKIDERDSLTSMYAMMESINRVWDHALYSEEDRRSMHSRLSKGITCSQGENELEEGQSSN